MHILIEDYNPKAFSQIYSQEFQRQTDAENLMFFKYSFMYNMYVFFIFCRAYNPAVSRNILTKWQPIWLGYRKAGVLH